MNSLKGCWKIIIVLCLFFLLSSGCVTQSPAENITSSSPPIFTAPIGGFVHPENNTIRDANVTFESDYLFYSGTFAGEVKYLVSSERQGQIWNDSSALYIEPSTFTAEPNHAYLAKVYLNASSIPKDFFIPQPNWIIPGTSIGVPPYSLFVNVSLDGKASQYCDDWMIFHSFTIPNHSWDVIEVENTSLSLKKGFTKNSISPTYRIGIRGWEKYHFHHHRLH